MPVILATQGVRDQKDWLKTTLEWNGSRDPISEKPNTKKRAGGVTPGVSLEFYKNIKQNKTF
jgi:hypothetical protein